MSRFNIEKAKQGHLVSTKSGKNVKILLYDRSNIHFPIVAIIENKEVVCYTNEGKFYADEKESDKDLKLK
jgi:hypothetical protein